jgi:hypothetical protein
MDVDIKVPRRARERGADRSLTRHGAVVSAMDENLLPACMMLLAETRVYLEQRKNEPQAASLLAKVDSVIRQLNESTRGPGRTYAD